MRSMGSNKKTIKQKIGALSVVTACRKHSRVSNIRKRKCCLKCRLNVVLPHGTYAQNDKTIINTIYRKPDFSIIKKMYLIRFIKQIN